MFRAAEFFQVRDLLPVCGDFIRREVVTKANFIQILKEGTAGSFDALETYIGERFLASTANKGACICDVESRGGNKNCVNSVSHQVCRHDVTFSGRHLMFDP